MVNSQNITKKTLRQTEFGKSAHGCSFGQQPDVIYESIRNLVKPYASRTLHNQHPSPLIRHPIPEHSGSLSKHPNNIPKTKPQNNLRPIPSSIRQHAHRLPTKVTPSPREIKTRIITSISVIANPRNELPTMSPPPSYKIRPAGFDKVPNPP